MLWFLVLWVGKGKIGSHSLENYLYSKSFYNGEDKIILRVDLCAIKVFRKTYMIRE